MTLTERAISFSRRSETGRSIVTSAALVGVRIGGTLATLGYTLLMTRTMSEQDVGAVWTIWAAALIIASLTTLNVGLVAMRELPRALAYGNTDLAAGFVRCGRLVLCATLPVALLAFVGVQYAFDPEGVTRHAWAYAFAVLTIPVVSWNLLQGGIAAALDKGVYSQAPRILRPVIILIGFLGVYLAAANPSTGFVLGLILASALLSAAIQYALLRPSFEFTRTAVPDTTGWRGWIAAGLLLTPTRIVGENLKNVIIVSAALSLAGGEVARLTVAFSLVALLNFGIAAIELSFAPKVSRAMATGEDERRDMLLATGSLLKLGPILVAMAALWFLAEPILALFGEGYTQAGDAVRWLMLMPFAKAAFGPAELLLQVAARRGTLFFLSLGGIVALVAGLAFGVGDGGVTDAARICALVYSGMLLANWMACRALTGADPSLINTARVMTGELRRRAVA